MGAHSAFLPSPVPGDFVPVNICTPVGHEEGRLQGTEESHPQADLSAVLLVGKIDNISSSGSIDLPVSEHPFVFPEDEQLPFEGRDF